MDDKRRLTVKQAGKKNLVFTVLLLFAAALLWIGYNRKSKDVQAEAQIYYQSKLVKTIALDKKEDKIFSISQKENVVFHLYADGTICFETSDCPDMVCVRTGRIGRTGQSAVCLPNEIVLKITPVHGESDVDVES